jgi:phytol kinase
MALILTILAVLAVLVASEIWWHHKRPHNEFSRKFIHITVGTFAAFWPYFLSWNEIMFLSLAFLIVVSASQFIGLFKAIHSVERPTWGEVCFAITVGVLAALTPEPLIFTAALLHISLSDGLAALVGIKFGRGNEYKVFGHKKSRAGSAAFFGSSLAILGGYAFLSVDAPHLLILLGLAAAATALENVAVRGIDNLAVPLLIAATLIIT